MTDQELMQWALDALDGYARNCGGGTCDAAEALRNRLEKWTARDIAYRPGGLPQPDLAQVGEVGVWGEREWKGLTDWEHEQIAIDCGCASADWVFYGAAVERKLKEKNT